MRHALYALRPQTQTTFDALLDAHLRPQRRLYSTMVHNSEFCGHFVAGTVQWCVEVLNFPLYLACSVYRLSISTGILLYSICPFLNLAQL